MSRKFTLDDHILNSHDLRGFKSMDIIYYKEKFDADHLMLTCSISSCPSYRVCQQVNQQRHSRAQRCIQRITMVCSITNCETGSLAKQQGNMRIVYSSVSDTG